MQATHIPCAVAWAVGDASTLLALCGVVAQAQSNKPMQTLQMPAMPDPARITLDSKTTALMVLDYVEDICATQPKCKSQMLPAMIPFMERVRKAGLIVAYGYFFETFVALYSGSTYERFMIHNRWFGPYRYGYWALIFLAAMQAIPRELFEVAAIDGATRLRQFWSVTIPQLRATIIFMVTISTIGGLQIFAEPLIFGGQNNATTGGDSGQFQTLSIFLYAQGFQSFKFGYAATIAWVLFLAVKGIMKLKKEEPPAPAPGPTPEVKLLTEIRDLLKNK